MGGLFGSSSNTKDTRISDIRIQSSAYGGVLPRVYGTQRITGNVVWYGDFKATAHKESAGKGGGSTHTSYSYSASLILALCEGIVTNVPTVWRDKEKITAGMSDTVGINVDREVHVIPDNLTITVEHTNGFVNREVVLWVGGEDPLGYTFTQSNNPSEEYATGGYKVDEHGVYTFISNDIGKSVAISYSYTVPPHEQSAADKAGFSMVAGETGQAIWSYLTDKHPEQAIPYSGMAYAAAANHELNSNAGIQNHSFEVTMQTAISADNPDANPATIIADFLTDPVNGAQFPANCLGDMTNYANYVTAAGLFLSPALTEQEEAQTILTRWLQATNSEVVWSEGVLKIIPYGDETLAANGASYTPNLTPVYDLTDDDFLSDGEAPVTIKRENLADAYNQVQVEYVDRANEYNTAVAEAKDQANIGLFGLRPMSAVSLHEICNADIARQVAQLILQRALYVRNTYEFKLGWRHCLLEPMDLVTLTDSVLGLNRVTVRVAEIQEDESGTLSIICEDWPFGTAGATKYPHQYSDSYGLNMNVSAGPCAVPVIFETSPEIFGGRQQLLIAASGENALWGGADVWLSMDGTTYKQIGKISARARYGVTTTALPVGASPDKTTTLGVDLSISDATLIGGTQADADALVTLFWLDGELIAYRDATLTATGKYNLDYLVRGGYGTPLLDHAKGASIVRMDDAVFGWEFPDELIGKQVHIKLTSFNAFGGGAESLAEAESYRYTLLGSTAATRPNGSSTGTDGSSPGSTDDPDVSLGYDALGNVIITFNRIDDPSIIVWELRVGESFEEGKALAQTRSSYFSIPLTELIGQKVWIKPLYATGEYGATTYSAEFAGEVLPAITGIATRVVEPCLEFSWPAVTGADHYVCYFEDGGVTTVRTVTSPLLLVRIPKYASLLRVYAVNTAGDNSPPYDQEIGLTGVYNENELANIALDMTTGTYANMAFTSSHEVEKVSLLGPASFTTPIASPNNAGCYTFGYNLKNVAGSALKNTPGTWFRKGFWYNGTGFYESSAIDLGQILSGRLKLQITKTVTAYGNGSGSAFAHVLGEYRAEATGLELADNKAFLSATFYISDSLTGSWFEAADGDWVTACRYVKIVVRAEHISPLTDCRVTACTLTLDVPDITETGTKTGVTSAGATVTLGKSYHAVSLVLLTPKGSVKAWPGTPNVDDGHATFTITTDSASGVDVGYFVKGY